MVSPLLGFPFFFPFHKYTIIKIHIPFSPLSKLYSSPPFHVLITLHLNKELKKNPYLSIVFWIQVPTYLVGTENKKNTTPPVSVRALRTRERHTHTPRHCIPVPSVREPRTRESGTPVHDTIFLFPVRELRRREREHHFSFSLWTENLGTGNTSPRYCIFCQVHWWELEGTGWRTGWERGAWRKIRCKDDALSVSMCVCRRRLRFPRHRHPHRHPHLGIRTFASLVRPRLAPILPLRHPLASLTSRATRQAAPRLLWSSIASASTPSL